MGPRRILFVRGALLSRINYREILGSGSLSLRPGLLTEREMMDQLFPRALLSTCPFSLVLETAVKPLEQGWSSGKRRGTKKGEKREKRKHETAGLPTTMGPYDPLCQWRSTADYRFDSKYEDLLCVLFTQKYFSSIDSHNYIAKIGNLSLLRQL